MEANEVGEQTLSTEVAEIIKRLQNIHTFHNSQSSLAHKLKASWIMAAISSLQGHLNVDNPPKHWEDVGNIDTVFQEE